MLRVTGAAVTHPGQIRKTNQDRALFAPNVGAVADGMGGHQGGEQAAAITIDIMSGLTGALDRQRLLDTVRAANQAVFDESERPELRGMGTTIVAAALHTGEARITMINVGDSRGYRLRDGELEQVTVDHSLVEELVRQGRITEEESRTHPQRNIVTRALGLGVDLDIDVFDLDARHGDRVLLCSDGLFNEVDVDVIAEQLRTIPEADLAADVLVTLACEGGGRDNISVVLLDIIDDEDPAAIRAAAEGVRRKTPAAAATVFEDVEDDEDIEIDPNPTDQVPTVIDHEPAEPVVPEPILAMPEPDPMVDGDRSRSRWVALAVVVTFLVALLGINWYGGGAYFAAEQSGQVVIFKGRPGGLLWVDPELEVETGVSIDELAPAGLQQLDQEVEWTSLSDAQTFVDQLERADPDAGG
ncbi:MAG: protein phosphatase 2C domain-containing protein [Ilumatobacter sp.]